MKNRINILFILKITSIYLILEMNLRILKNHISEIHLIIQGNGTQNLLSDDFDILPSEAIVNGLVMPNCSKTCFLTGNQSNITLKFNSEINKTHFMFYQLKNVTFS